MDNKNVEDDLPSRLAKYGEQTMDSIGKMASSVARTVIPGAFSHDEFRLRTANENQDCKPLKSVGLELLKMEDRTGRSPFVCGMRALIPKSSPSMERNMRLDMNSKFGELKVIEFFTTGKPQKIPVDDVYLLGNIKKQSGLDTSPEQTPENMDLKKGRGR